MAELVFLSGWELDGATINILSVNSSERCLVQCRQDNQCEYAIYRVRESSCLLKNTPTNFLRNGTSVLTAASYKKFIALSNTLFTGYTDLALAKTVSEEKCRLLCAVHPQANACTWQASQGICMLRAILQTSSIALQQNSAGYTLWIS